MSSLSLVKALIDTYKMSVETANQIAEKAIRDSETDDLWFLLNIHAQPMTMSAEGSFPCLT